MLSIEAATDSQFRGRPTSFSPGMAQPRAALLLIDMQKAFTTGSWAKHFGGPTEVEDISRACREAAKLLRLQELPILRRGLREWQRDEKSNR